MKTNFTSYELMNILKGLFSSDNDFALTITDSQGEGTQTNSILDYLNIDFYTFKKELKDLDILEDIDNQNKWLVSLNDSMNKAYGLVEVNSNEPISSYGFDGGSVEGRVSFIIQADKVPNLEFYVSYLRNKYIGILEDLIKDNVNYTIHISIGDFNYDTEPFQSVLGQCVIVSFNITIAYMEKCYSYQDEIIEFSFDENGTYYTLPFSKGDENLIYTGRSMVMQNRADKVGNINSSITTNMDFVFWLISSNEFINKLQDLAYQTTAYKIDNEEQTSVNNINTPIYVKRTYNGKTYIHKMVLLLFSKAYVNNDFTIGTIKLALYGR